MFHAGKQAGSLFQFAASITPTTSAARSNEGPSSRRLDHECHLLGRCRAFVVGEVEKGMASTSMEMGVCGARGLARPALVGLPPRARANRAWSGESMSVASRRAMFA